MLFTKRNENWAWSQARRLSMLKEKKQKNHIISKRTNLPEFCSIHCKEFMWAFNILAICAICNENGKLKLLALIVSFQISTVFAVFISNHELCYSAPSLIFEEQIFSSIEQLFTWHQSDFHFIPEQVHSLYFFASVQMLPRQNFVPVQIIPEWVHSGFHSERDSRSGTNFILVACKMKVNFVPDWKSQFCTLGRVAHAYLIWRENPASQNAFGWPVRFHHVNAVRTSLWNETLSGVVKLARYCKRNATISYSRARFI